MKMKIDKLKEILLNLDLEANKELDDKKKRSLVLIKQWFKSYSDNIGQESLLRIWSKQWSLELKDCYYNFPVPNELDDSVESKEEYNSVKITNLEICTKADRYCTSEYRLYKVEEVLFLKFFKDQFIYLVGHDESYITATSKNKLEETAHLVLLKNDTEAILLDGNDLKLEVKAA